MCTLYALAGVRALRLPGARVALVTLNFWRVEVIAIAILLNYLTNMEFARTIPEFGVTQACKHTV